MSYSKILRGESNLYLACFVGGFSAIAWLLGWPWYSVAILVAGMIALRVWAALAMKLYDRDRAA